MDLLRSTIQYGTTGLTSLLCLTGSVLSQGNEVARTMFLVSGSVQGIMCLVSANDNEQAEAAHNDRRDVEAQARVQRLSQSLIYGEEGYGEQLWLTLRAMREGGYREEEMLGLLSKDVGQARAILARLTDKYGVL